MIFHARCFIPKFDLCAGPPLRVAEVLTLFEDTDGESLRGCTVHDVPIIEDFPSDTSIYQW
jgi:hypothetical protein